MQRTFKIAYQALVALELRNSGCACVSKDFKHVNPQHHLALCGIVLSNPVIKLWYDPPESYLRPLHPFINTNMTRVLDDEEASSNRAAASKITPLANTQDAAAAIQRGMAKLQHVSNIAANLHRYFAQLAIKAVLGQFWS